MAYISIGRVLSFALDKVLVRWRNPGDTADMGTLADPVRVDPTGTTTQPVSAAALPLPAGAATEATLATRASQATLATMLTEAEFETRVGEVQTTPTANTVLGRLKDLLTGIVLSAGTALIGIVEDRVDSQVLITKTLDWTGAITASTVWDPAASNRFVITDIMIGCSAACTVTLFDETDNETKRVCKFDLAQYGGVVINFRKPRAAAAVNNTLRATCSAAGGYITVNGYETT